MSTRDQTDHWNDLLHVTRSWRLEWRLDQLLARVVKEAVGFLHLQRGAIYLLEKDGAQLRAFWPDDLQHKKLVTESQQVAEQVIRRGRSVFAHVLSGSKAKRNGGGRASRDVYCVPLTASRGILGALYVDAAATQQGLSQQGQEFLEMLGLQAAVAIEHGLLYQSAITDPLTGLYSHRHFQQELEQAVRRAQRSSQRLALIMLDLDKFKQLNDTHGHEVGNSCLQQLARLLRNTLRSTDVIARFGGDEFEILLPDTNAEQAALVADKIRAGIAKLDLPQGSRVGGTLGVAEFPANASTAQALFLCADAALYEAKEAGRNRVVRSRAKAASASGLQQRAAAAEESGFTIATPPPLPNEPVAEMRTMPAGEAIDGHALVGRMGVGSSGEVLLVRQPELDREVALKRPLTPHLTEDQRKSFEREARVTASLNHPGVITVHTMGTDADGRRYYTMKPMRGMSLQDVLEARTKDAEARQKYSTPALMEILQRVSETIAYAHSQGVAHLDLTPQNIMVGQFGEVTVIDWGASGRSSDSKRRGSRNRHAGLKFLSGSAAFAAPEHLQASVIPGPPADVHAMGAILYMILTGQSPYRRGNTLETLESILNSEVPRPEKIAPREEIDPALSNLCMNALKRDPRQRPSAREFAERLARFVRKEPDWVMTRFGRDGAELRQEDWHYNEGWTLKNGVWSCHAERSTILWKTPVPAGFEFECECWADDDIEMVLVARQNLAQSTFGAGYAFKFGAEWNTCTMLQHTFGSRVVMGLSVKAKQRYRLAIHYSNRWISCFIDGRRIFEEREIFHVPGMHLGMGVIYPGVHFRPLHVRRQSWSLSIPVFQMADELLGAKQYEHAHRIYSELASAMGDRLEGLESRFKAGVCLIRLNRHNEARQV
ncbi:MAG TPA: diguanylate cyclase, partial [Planctomycetota bacterium]|nr:diguanylate cyclase [Planctomycetota bacterium]